MSWIVTPSCFTISTTKGDTELAPTIMMTRGDLEDRRAELLARLHMSLAEFSDVVETSTLTGEEWEVRDELEDIAFLLGEKPAWVDA